MSCFTLQWLEQVLVYLVVLFAIIAIIKILVPFVLSLVGVPVVGQVINIVLWAIVAIIVIYICFALIGCLVGMGGGFHSLMPPHPGR